MQNFETLSIGDTVFVPHITTKEVEVECPDCLGEKLWTILMPSGQSRTIDCPRCQGGKELWLIPKRYERALEVKEVTISRISVEQRRPYSSTKKDADKEIWTSICYETTPSVGGSVRHELAHRTRAEAEAAGALLLEKQESVASEAWKDELARREKRAGMDIVRALQASANEKFDRLEAGLDKLRENLLEAVRYPTLYGPKTTKRIYGGEELTGQNLADWLNQQFSKADLDGWTEEELHEAMCQC